MVEKTAFSGFYKLPLEARQRLITEKIGLLPNELNTLNKFCHLSAAEMDKMGENVIGTYDLPFSIATHFRINGHEILIPMVTEEASVVAAASNGARIARPHGGFSADPISPIMIGQIQISRIQNEEEIESITKYIAINKHSLLNLANQCDPKLCNAGGGAYELICKPLKTSRGLMVILELYVNVVDAMGGNAVNSMAEAVGNYLKGQVPGVILLRILSNLVTTRLAHATAIFDKDLLGGSTIVEDILDAWAFAASDPYRAATHNKGILNGISALTIATGNDTRAIEAGAHAYAAQLGKNGTGYAPLTQFNKTMDGHLMGQITLPMALGIVGGITTKHPMSQIALKILGVKSASELGQIAAALGLAQNLAALRAMVSEGIQMGHMKLHKRKM
jgi:hydroxymethylglutaryl-CoA reductase